jgi:hypothetical protein
MKAGNTGKNRKKGKNRKSGHSQISECRVGNGVLAVAHANTKQLSEHQAVESCATAIAWAKARDTLG